MNPTKGALTFIFLLSPVFSQAEEIIKLTTADGKTIQALLFGAGETGLILCHGRGYKSGAASFQTEAAYLENKGLMCLAISFRGYPSDSPPYPKGGGQDIVAALEYLVSRGVKRVFCLGSSMGGFIVLEILPKLEKYPEFSGIIILSAFHPEACKSSKVPKLFVAAEDDTDYFSKTSKCFEEAAKPKKFIAYKNGGHGQSLFQSQRTALLDDISLFIRGEK